MRSVKVGLNEKWYLGLDIGTNSVGFCATNASYDILTKGNKLQAGARLFEEAHDASTRRVKRSIRRQRARLRNRIDMLQAIFADNIDDKFFLSLNESRLYLDDKTVKNKYTLFNDSDFTDVDFYKKFPTIYHLRQYLLTTPAPDIRLLYLVCHHMMKNRGHFLFQEFNPKQSSSNIQSIIESINDGIKKVFSDSNDAVNLKLLSTDNIEQKFAEAKKIKRETDCWSKLAEILNPAKDSLLTKIFKIVKGDKISLNVFNPENTNEACEEILGSDILKKLKFKEATFDENFAKVTDSGLLTDDQISLIVHCKELYDCIKLNLILDGAETISEAMLKRYNNHKNDLRVLKSFVKNNYPESYSDLFRDTNKDAKFATYTNYVKSSISNNKKVVSYCQRCVSAIPKEDRKNVLVTSEYDSFIKTVKSLIESKGLAESAKESEEYKYIKAKLDENTFCKKLRTIDNAYFPNQLNAYELRKILLTQQTLFPDFLTDDVIEKIIKLLTFRIPYYVGPLSDLHDKFSWVKRTTPHSTTPITPFNFNEEIDEFATGEAFITRMISKCTYLKNEYVLPKQSILYQEYMVLNELNNLKINGNRITQDIKEFLYKDVCLRKSNITKSVLIKSLKNAGKITDNDTLGKGDDLDPGFKSSLSSLISCKNILGVKYDQNLTTNQLLMCENIIRYLTVFGDEKQPVKERIDKEYGSILTEDQIEKFLNLSCAAWGRLSRKFLSGIKTTELKAPLNEVSIIDILKNTTMNLMEILNSNYYAESFIDIVRNINNEQDGNNQITYDDVNNLYCSPAVKRAIWQAYLITDELVKINKTPPAGVFIEVTRSEDIAKKKKLQSSRKQVIEELIKNIKSDPKYDGYAPDKLNNELTKLTNDKLRSDKIFFYFMQLGRCMYSGEPIDLDELLNNNNKYDIDHIYPQCQILDDSLSNRVLVYRSENLKKGKNYPIANSVRDKMIRFWNLLHAKKFIDDKKLQRLKSASPISESEIAAFNNRQLVNTSQAAKCVAEILQKKFQSSKTKIVYSKAEVVSRFRQLMKIVKCRFINDIHHAHDAYLNIVVGNVWYQMFTNRAVSGSDRYANLVNAP